VRKFNYIQLFGKRPEPFSSVDVGERHVLSGFFSSAGKAKKQILLLLGTSLLLMLSSCTQTRATTDPLERFNRGANAFNGTLDRVFLKPVTQGYVAVAPGFVETGVSNFFDNASYPVVFVNQFLQGKVVAGLQDTSRFIINSTIGIGGLFDVASSIGLDEHNEDFGQTLGAWGVDTGPYLVLPFWGPATFRDGFGDILGSYGYLPRYIDHVPTRNSVYALGVIDKRAGALAAEQLLSGDRYLFLRDAYLQQRQFLVDDGEQEIDPFLD